MKGGYDVANDEEVFSFLLEDVLSFERGQEVADMVSVFLDPDITVQPLDGDVSLRGIIELQGEYDRLQERVENEEGVLNKDTFEVRNFVDKVVDIGEERAIFSHQFPVEITIPEYRVNNIEDIKMEIENFDYELIAPDEIKIESSIIIHGINQEASAGDSRDVDEEEKTLFSIEKQKDVEKQRKEESVPELNDTSLERIPEVPELEADEEVIAEPEAASEEEHESLVPVEQEKQLHISARSIEDKEADIDPEEDADEDADASVQDRNIDYLKSMFGGEQESGHTKVRLCIVQERDTVDSIAEKYEVKKSQILIKNQLEDEEIVEGQLLQIPNTK